jgi:tetratricopeptide (TPR) repeat protein
VEGRGAMAQELSVASLVVCARMDPPTPEALRRAFTAAGLGAAEYAPAGARSPLEPVTRQRLGTYTLNAQGLPAQARVTVYRSDDAVTEGMSEAAFGRLTRGLSIADVATMRDGPLSFDARLTTDARAILPSLAWMMRALRLFAETTGGVVVDPACQRCYSRTDLAQFQGGDASAFIVIHNDFMGGEDRWLHTHGLQKFGRPELEFVHVPQALEPEALAFLREMAANFARGVTLVSGQEIQDDQAGALLAIGSSPDLDHQAPYARLRLIDLPAPGERESASARRFLARMALGEAARYARAGDTAQSYLALDRILAANPDDGPALLLKAQINLREGRPLDALELGEILRLRVPSDFRGHLMVGFALAALGRQQEALSALNAAIQWEPESAEAFAKRAEIYDRMGERKLAAYDRAHAAHLRA